MPEGFSYETLLVDFYDTSAKRVAELLDDGLDVALVCEGDPFFYGSYMYMHNRLAGDYATEVVPAVPSIAAGAPVLGTPLVCRDEVLCVLSGVLSEDELATRLATGRGGGDEAGPQPAQGARRRRAGRPARPRPLRGAGHDGQPAGAAAGRRRPGHGAVLLDGGDPEPHGADPMTGAAGSVTVVGLGPGGEATCTPEVTAALRQATDLVGYGPYLDMAAALVPPAGVRHASDNREEGDRARHALDLAAAGEGVVVVSSGDPGVFAMAAAVVEQLDGDGPGGADTARWAGVEVTVLPGISAAQAAAARAGAPLGHDFCVISLSDNLKPWAVVERG